jgi:hypothetical protein
MRKILIEHGSRGKPRSRRSLNRPQIDLLFGSLLGDGSLQTFGSCDETEFRTCVASPRHFGSEASRSSKTDVSLVNWRYRVLQGLDSAEYVDYKYGIMANLCATLAAARAQQGPRAVIKVLGAQEKEWGVHGIIVNFTWIFAVYYTTYSAHTNVCTVNIVAYMLLFAFYI